MYLCQVLGSVLHAWGMSDTPDAQVASGCCRSLEGVGSLDAAGGCLDLLHVGKCHGAVAGDAFY